jgi:hypothetical protein
MKRETKTYIYVLKCPKTLLVKYVGKTIDIKNRLRSHLKEKNKTLKCKWIIGLKKQNLLPIFEVIEEIEPFGDWEIREKYHIAYYKSIGQAFCNLTLGGEGGSSFGKNLSQSHKDSISKSNKGMPNPNAILSNVVNKGFRVEQLDLDGNLIAVHSSTHEAARVVNRSQRRLQAMCKYGHMNGRTINHVAGFKFRYEINN